VNGALLRSIHNYSDRADPASEWAARLEFTMRRTWWRRVRFTPGAINGMLQLSAAMQDLARMLGQSEVAGSKDKPV
jgi:hypothetical protein